MKQLQFQWVLYLIIAVIISTIGIQVYWNYKNYETNKQQLINDVQVSLDNAVDDYYANLAQDNTMAFALKLDDLEEFEDSKTDIDSFIKHIDFITKNNVSGDSLRINFFENTTNLQSNDTISHKNGLKEWHANKLVIRSSTKQSLDSLTQDNFKMLTSKVIFAMASDTLKLESIDSLLKKELHRKELDLNYNLLFNSPFDSLKTSYIPLKEAFLSTRSKSTYLPRNSSLEIQFSNVTKTVLKRILFSILISVILVLGVIACLIYLLNIIKHQKQVAEVKNDLISNITHEFKTPIATIGVAIESLKNFNAINDKVKTQSYLDMSGEQLDKLNTMVEKLLETASLDSENLELTKESTNIKELIKKLIFKNQLQTTTKTLEYEDSESEIFGNIDVFHFENAINNVLDNAVKYGGNIIRIQLSQTSKGISIIISDNENTMSQVHKNKIFDKFYRIPKGNTHDIKGFGIGLFYTKKIIENHGGTITLELGNNKKAFKIFIPNG